MDEAEVTITEEMIEAGAWVIEDWAHIEDARALARRVYSAMARASPSCVPARPDEP